MIFKGKICVKLFLLQSPPLQLLRLFLCLCSPCAIHGGQHLGRISCIAPSTWQMLTFLIPLDTLIPTTDSIFFSCRTSGPGHFWGAGVSLSRIFWVGVPSIQPFFEGGSSERAASPPPLPFPPEVGWQLYCEEHGIGPKTESAHGRGIQSVRTDHCSRSPRLKARPPLRAPQCGSSHEDRRYVLLQAFSMRFPNESTTHT